MKNLFFIFVLSFSSVGSAGDYTGNVQTQYKNFELDKAEYLSNRCVINGADLWFIHTCKDIAYEAELILSSKGYYFSKVKIEIALDQPMKTHIGAVRITSRENYKISQFLTNENMVGKVVAHNTYDIKKAKYLVLSRVDENLDLQVIDSIRIGKQGLTNDLFCHNSIIMAQKYLNSLRKLEPCKSN